MNKLYAINEETLSTVDTAQEIPAATRPDFTPVSCAIPNFSPAVVTALLIAESEESF